MAGQHPRHPEKSDRDDREDAARKLPDSEEEREALRLAETTDVSQNQAKELLRKHGGNSAEAEKEARNFKAEG